MMPSHSSNESFNLMSFLQNLPDTSGCYLMHNAVDEVIYVGKAKNLKRRVASYFARQQDHPKTRAMVAQVARIEIMLTASEAEAFILEYTLIKKHHPRYNIIFRDDKSYPYLYLSTQQDFPGLYFYRGARKKEGRLFGPFPSAPSVYEALNLLQKVFPIRQCNDTFYRNRTRPCLQYEIKRCTAPCVGLVDKDRYGRDVQDTIDFLEGRSQQMIEQKQAAMLAAAEVLDFERAAALRDQIQHLQSIQSKQFVVSEKAEDADVIAVMEDDRGQQVVQLSMIRGGNLWGSSSHFPKHADQADEGLVLSAFILQHYAGRDIPPRLIVSHTPEDKAGLLAWLVLQSGKRIHLVTQPRGMAVKWLQLVQDNARQALIQRSLTQRQQQQLLQSMQDKLQLTLLPKHMICFDISHLQGTGTIASEVVFIDGVAAKQAYRRYNILDITPGDDPAAMRQVVHRCLLRAVNEQQFPDLMIVDGGKTQLRMAMEQCRQMGIQDEQMNLLAIAKGEGRKAGLETYYRPGDEVGVLLSADDPVAHLLQRIRDEAHRFAITGQRNSRKKGLHSILEEVPGVGAKTRSRLLKAFGSLVAIQGASMAQLQSVQGVNVKQAQAVYHWFRDSEPNDGLAE
jgi:excinuclease ABC subunit C